MDNQVAPIASERTRTGAGVFREAPGCKPAPPPEASPELDPASFGSAWGYVGPKGGLVRWGYIDRGNRFVVNPLYDDIVAGRHPRPDGNGEFPKAAKE